MKRVGLGLCLVLALSGCPRREARFTIGEAEQALQEAAAASQAEGLTATSADLATSFTLGAGVEQAVAELGTLLATQLPCAQVSREGATLTVEYGALPGNCGYRGHELSGVARITVSSNGDFVNDEAVVQHEWLGLSNGVVSLDGTATVTWDFGAQTRHVTHDTRWTSLRSGRVVEGSGDRMQLRVNNGIRVDGIRSWEGQQGLWELTIDGIDLRWDDPIPQAGRYTLSSPSERTLSMSFARVDEDSIRVTVAADERDTTTPSGQREFHFTVSKLGLVERARD